MSARDADQLEALAERIANVEEILLGLIEEDGEGEEPEEPEAEETGDRRLTGDADARRARLRDACRGADARTRAILHRMNQRAREISARGAVR